jgi:hypothetical protein
MVENKEAQELVDKEALATIKIIETMLVGAREEGVAFAEKRIIHCGNCRYGNPVPGAIPSAKDPIRCDVDPLEKRSFLMEPGDFCSLGQKK